MIFTKDGKKNTLKGLTYGSPKIITSHHMEKLSKPRKVRNYCTVQFHTSGGHIPIGDLC